MPSDKIKQQYSCKRKRDWMTFASVSMFVLLIIFQIWLVFIVPVQLRDAALFEREQAKDAMSSRIDGIRDRIRKHSAPDSTNNGEIKLVRDALNEIALFLRENKDSLDLAQIAEISKTISQFEAITARWFEESPRFIIKENQIDFSGYLKSLEKTAYGETIQ